ncbi:MAG: hypothetical protein KC502_04000 [Myxococcales bacterium]|nr:hypothetical protein [Myxococcales bacterium]
MAGCPHFVAAEGRSPRRGGLTFLHVAAPLVAGLPWATGALAARPFEPDQATRVLPVGIEKTVEAGFLRAAPSWRLDSDKIDRVTVAAKVCDSTGVCHELALSDPLRACKGQKAGAWCVVWKAAAPAAASALDAVLGQDAPGAVCHTIVARPKQPDVVHSEESAPPQASGGEHYTDEERPTLTLIAGLVAAAVAMFALFRVTDDDDEGEQSDPAGRNHLAVPG